MITRPEIIVTPDSPTIKFRNKRNQEGFDLDTELFKILHVQGWGCGTYFNVQFLNHDRNKLEESGVFVVTEEDESLHTTDNPYHPVTKTIHTRKCEQIGGWWRPAVLLKDTKGTVVWNPGKRKHEVMVNDECIYESDDKDECREIAAGNKPIPN